MPKAKVDLHFERSYWQKQPLEMFCKKRCSWKFRKIHRNTCARSPFLIKLHRTDVRHKYKKTLYSTSIRNSHQRCSVKKGVIRYFTEFKGKHLSQSLFFNTVAGAYNCIKKETLAQVFSCEFCEIFKNTFCTEHLRTTAPEVFFKFLNVFISSTYLKLNSIIDPERKECFIQSVQLT